MGGTLTKELLGLAGVSTCRLARSSRGACGWWWNITGEVGGLVEHTVGSSGHRPPVGGVPGTGRSLDHEPLRGSSSSGEGSGGRRVWWGRGRWLFENCTVDASIFVKIKTHPFGGVVLGSLQFCCFC